MGESDRQWDIETIAQALGASPAPTEHVAFGNGVRISLGKEQRRSLELFPQASLARLTTEDALVNVFRVEPTEISEYGVVFEARPPSPSLRLSIVSSGAISLTIPEVQEITARASSEGPSAASAEPNASATEAQPRVSLFGRIGASPSYRTTPKGTLVGRFPLAEHNDDQTTTWHTVLAFGHRAQSLQAGGLAKGQQVEVLGYQHTRQGRTRDGHDKQIVEIYAVAVRAR